MSRATSPGYLRYPPPAVFVANVQSRERVNIAAELPLMTLPFLVMPSIPVDDTRVHDNRDVSSSSSSMQVESSMRMQIQTEIEATAPMDTYPCTQLSDETCRLTIPHAVLCSEMGAHFSPSGRYLAACVACTLPQMEGDPGLQTLVHHDAGAATSPTRHPISAHQVMYELRIYSLEEATFGSVLVSRAITAAHCLTFIHRRWRPILARIHDLATADGLNPLIVDDPALAADALPVEVDYFRGNRAWKSAHSILQALLYWLSGEYNSLHSDPAIATIAGFSRPKLHGWWCTHGFAVRGVIKCIGRGGYSKQEQIYSNISQIICLKICSSCSARLIPSSPLSYHIRYSNEKKGSKNK